MFLAYDVIRWGKRALVLGAIGFLVTDSILVISGKVKPVIGNIPMVGLSLACIAVIAVAVVSYMRGGRS